MKQKNSAPLRRRTVTVAVVGALSALAASPACADPMLTIKLFRDSEVMFRDADMSRWADNYVELGVGYNSHDSVRFGQFSGLTDKGGFPIVGFNWLTRDQANDAQYWQIHGANLGLDSRKFQAQGGVQGNWNLNFSVDQLKKSQTDTARFYHQGLGTSSLTFPVASRAANANTNFPATQFSPFEIQHGRDIYRIGLNALLSKEWDFKVNYREDQRDGSRLTGFIYSNGRASILPYQIDDKTQQIEAILAYANKVAQFQLGYTYSKFSNNLNAFDVQSPYTGSELRNRLSLAPDNDHHQFNASGAYNFSKATRLSATYSYGIARQNEAFLAYSVNGTGGANTAAVLPRSSLDGKVINTLLDVALTTKPIDKMNLKVAYQYRDSDNRTPIDKYRYVSRDAASGVPALNPAGAAAAAIRTNAPVSTTEQKISLDGDYELAARTVLRAGLEHSNKKYTLSDRTDTQTNKLSIELRRPVSDEFLGSVGYVYTQRRGSDYDKNAYFRNTYTAQGFQDGTNTSGRLTNNPSMRSFIYADFNEDRLRASGNWTVSETISLQGVVEGYQQKMRGPNCGQYSDALQPLVVTPPLSSTCLGRESAEGGSVSLDVQYQPEENLTTFAFANFSQSGLKEIGRTWTRTNATGALDNKNWYGDIVARDHTLGLGLKWQPEEKWDLGATYVYNYGVGKSMIDQAASTNITVIAASQPMPDTWNKLHTLQLFAKWDYSKQLSWRFNYLYENLKSYDWAISDLGTTVPALSGMFLTGMQAPRYSNHVFGVSAVVKSW
ncbi:MAG: MtrB/PioB family decaheme-associated outer membrane protein [Sulfuritalea sp.]|nr:MtrB/PioB family decaheme-associated outer membrane protein [Sulfuritalea sp.]